MRTVTVLFTLLAWSIASPSMAQKEITVRMSDLPPAVRQAVDTETKGATVKGLSKEVEKGQTFYEAETLVNGRSRDILVDASGKVVEVEEQIDPKDAPTAVRAALQNKGTLLRLESVKHGDKPVTYEALVKNKAGKRSEIALDADGKPVGR